MKKWQLLLQKTSMILVLISIVSLMVYAWSFMTPYNNMELIDTNIPIYKDLQTITNLIFNLSVWMIIGIAVITILGGFYRKKYYMGNYISVGLFVVLGFISSGLLFVNLSVAKSKVAVAIKNRETFLAMYPAEVHPVFGPEFTTAIVDSGYLFVVLLLISVVLVTANLIWTFILQRRTQNDRKS